MRKPAIWRAFVLGNRLPQCAWCAVGACAGGSWANFCEQSLHTCHAWNWRAPVAGFFFFPLVEEKGGGRGPSPVGAPPFFWVPPILPSNVSSPVSLWARVWEGGGAGEDTTLH